MRLTIENDRERIGRYAHVRPAPGGPSAQCGAQLSGTKRRCSLAPGHSGPHVAHGAFRRVLAVWDSGSVAVASEESRRNRAQSRTQGGLPSRRSVDPWPLLASRLRVILASPEELFMLILVLAFLGFAVHWLLLIMG
jgi:hypothetical protein